MGVCKRRARMKLSLDAGRPIRSDPPKTIAGGLAISAPIAASLERVRALVDEVVLVDDDEIRGGDGTDRRHDRRPRRAFRAAGVAAVRSRSVPGERIAVILTGAWQRPDWKRTVG